MSTVNQAPQFKTRKAARIGLEFYGIEADVSELASERDQNFLLKGRDGKAFILKIANANEERAVLEFQNRAMAHVANGKDGTACPQVVPSKDGREIAETRDESGTSHFIRLITFIPGTPLAQVKPQTPELLFDLGRFVGRLTQRLRTFSFPGGQRELIWDMRQGPQIVRQYLEDISDPPCRALVEEFLRRFEKETGPSLAGLSLSVIHNDANDHNIIVSDPEKSEELFGQRQVAGLIDFGDMIESWTLVEPAVACAYAMLDKDDPLAAAAQVIAGFHAVRPVAENELEVLPQLILMRLLMSVAIGAHQTKAKPGNSYLSVSQKSAWSLLQRLKAVHPRLVWYIFRHACGFTPCPDQKALMKSIETAARSSSPVVGLDLNTSKRTVFDLGPGSLLIGDMRIVDDTLAFSELLFGEMKKNGAEVGIGKYDEARIVYMSKAFKPASNPLAEGRTVHLGIDLFLKPGTPVFAPLDGAVHSFRNNAAPKDYGPAIILEHLDEGGRVKFYTLYGHLCADSLEGLYQGKSVRKGERIASIGRPPDNGDWPPHLHFQVITDMLGMEGDFPGVCRPGEREIWLGISPNPHLILGLPADDLSSQAFTSEKILGLRKSHIGPNLSISYKKPLKIVRGFLQHLYDDTGRMFLDSVNNVPHVGHCHPRVVKAAREQAAVLNTNTRYLHDNLVRYAERLCQKLPEPLRVCYIVNSGSEANDLALRLARVSTGAEDMIVVDGAYHGHLTSLIDISPYKFDGPGGPGRPTHTQKVVMPDLYQGPYRAGDPEAGVKYAARIWEAIDRIKKEGRRPAGFICESLLSCGGQIVLPEGYLKEAYRQLREAGGVCIADEVQVGFGRVGTHFWGFETQGVVPDIVTMGKPIGNGHPLAAVVTSRKIADAFNTGMEYFNTYGGNPVSCAVGLAVLDVIEDEDLQQNALRAGGRLKAGLERLKEKYPVIGDVRGLGLFLGVELVTDRETRGRAALHASYAAERMREEGILISTDGPFHNVLKIKPPIVFSEADADIFLTTLDAILSEDPLR